MVEAITSAGSASLARVTAERKVPVIQAPYISPYIHIDNEKNKAVIQIRDGQTGKVLEQIPSSPTIVTETAAPKQTAPAPQQAAETSAPQAAQTAAPATPVTAASSASFGAFAKQVASIQTAIVGAGTGGTVSVLA